MRLSINPRYPQLVLQFFPAQIALDQQTKIGTHHIPIRDLRFQHILDDYPVEPAVQIQSRKNLSRQHQTTVAFQCLFASLSHLQNLLRRFCKCSIQKSVFNALLQKPGGVLQEPHYCKTVKFNSARKQKITPPSSRPLKR